MEAISMIKNLPKQGVQEVSNLAAVIPCHANRHGAQITERQAAMKSVTEIQKVTNAKIEHIAQAMENYMRSAQRDLKIQIHGATGKVIVKVISKENGEIIREIPPKELLDLAAKLEKMTGILFNENA